jgi:hypothetical protein
MAIEQQVWSDSEQRLVDTRRQTDFNTATGAARTAAEIIEAANDHSLGSQVVALDSNFAGITKLIDELHSKLGPILLPEPPIAARDPRGIDVPPRSDLATNLATKNATAQAIIGGLNQLIRRIDL